MHPRAYRGRQSTPPRGASLSLLAAFATAAAGAAFADEKDQLSVGLCQIMVGADKSVNLDVAHDAVRDAVSNGAQIVMLPEMFNCPYSNDSFGPYSEIIPLDVNDSDNSQTPLCPKTNPTSYFMRQLAVEYGVYILGSLPEKVVDDGKVFLYNTALVFSPTGQLVAKHRKMHLFDIDVPGKIRFKESETLTAGDQVTTFDTEFGKIGLGICYDIRFAEYAQICAAKGCRVLLYPGAFNTTTGPAHWELLQRGRALDNQLFVVTCSPARDPGFSYQAWGHSTAVSPWGDVVATTGHEPDTVIAKLDLSKVDEVRQNIPIGNQKRTDVYKLPSLV